MTSQWAGFVFSTLSKKEGEQADEVEGGLFLIPGEFADGLETHIDRKLYVVSFRIMWDLFLRSFFRCRFLFTARQHSHVFSMCVCVFVCMRE